MHIYYFYKLNYLSDHMSIISVIIFVKICIMHDRINFPILYELTYTFSGGLLRHLCDNLYCMWYNTLMGYIVSIVWPTEHFI